VHPVSAKALGKTYHLAIGQMTIDLRHVSFHKGSPKVKATVGMGQLVVLVPDGANVRVHARAGAGMVNSFNHSESGLDVEHTFNHGPGTPTVILDLAVGLGQVTVHK
jgi:predicted membrane protein